MSLTPNRGQIQFQETAVSFFTSLIIEGACTGRKQKLGLVLLLQDRNMDFSVLPNNNHPDKFLQLEVKSLVKNSALLQASLAKFPAAALPGVQRWHNRVYFQVRSKRG